MHGWRKISWKLKVGAFAAWDIAQHPPGPRARSILICRARRDERGRARWSHARCTSPKVYLRPRGFPDFTPHRHSPREHTPRRTICLCGTRRHPAIRQPAAHAAKFVTRPILFLPPKYSNPLLFLFQVSREEKPNLRWQTTNAAQHSLFRSKRKYFTLFLYQILYICTAHHRVLPHIPSPVGREFASWTQRQRSRDFLAPSRYSAYRP